jgi:hypothetical protein
MERTSYFTLYQVNLRHPAIPLCNHLQVALVVINSHGSLVKRASYEEICSQWDPPIDDDASKLFSCT